MASRVPNIFLLAGEPSGDRIGAALMQDIRSKRDLNLTGVGGPQMTGAGLSSIYPMRDLSVMGYSDVIKRLPLLLWRMRQTVRTILKTKPDAVVLIDSQAFSTMLAKRLRKAGFSRPILLYVAPAVWAWKPERAPGLVPLFDEILSVLPFEPDVLKRLGGPGTHYVGHPAMQTTRWTPERAKPGLLGLLPGSRDGEIRRHMPLLRRVVEELGPHPQVTGFVMPTLPHLADRLRAETAGWAAPVELVTTADEREAAIANMQAAIVTAGTITLELALAGIPMVGTYVPDPRLMQHYEKAGRPMVALPNAILGERVIPEIVPGPDLPERLVAETLSLLDNRTQRQIQRKAFKNLRKVMASGTKDAPCENAAERVLAALD